MIVAFRSHTHILSAIFRAHLGIKIVCRQSSTAVTTGRTVPVATSWAVLTGAGGPHVPAVLVGRFQAVYIAVLPYMVYYHLPIEMLKVNNNRLNTMLLTHLSRMEFPTIINWTNAFPF